MVRQRNNSSSLPSMLLPQHVSVIRLSSSGIVRNSLSLVHIPCSDLFLGSFMCVPLKLPTAVVTYLPWIPLKIEQRFEGTHPSSCYLLHAGFLIRLFFDPENVGDMFLRNVGSPPTEYTALHPRRQNSSPLTYFSSFRFTVPMALRPKTEFSFRGSSTLFLLFISRYMLRAKWPSSLLVKCKIQQSKGINNLVFLLMAI
jgi:hypothetical protein